MVTGLLLVTSGCTSNGMYRPDGIQPCNGNTCTHATIEQHEQENYDLTFVEFSERGNVFDRKKMNQVLEYIKTQEQQAKDGIMLLVYVHGWRHNASNRLGGDIHDFRKMLKIISKNKTTPRKVIGLYIGWRGLSLKTTPLNLVTYWGRKNIADQVGNGGVSELLLQLNQITKHGHERNRNILAITGHSFGAAVVLAALNDILLERLVTASKLPPEQCQLKSTFPHCQSGCYKTAPFGDAVVLINPAVEANELIQIKELITEKRCFDRNQPKLLHILSSDKDLPTRYAFSIGQFLGVSLRNHEYNLPRDIPIGDSLEKKTVIYDEYSLDTTTVGNYPPFRTGRSQSKKDMSRKEIEMCKDKNSDQCYTPCEGKNDCVSKYERLHSPEHIPVAPFEPVSIIYGDSSFMSGHTDIFNAEVLAYIATAIIENQYKNNSTAINALILQSCTILDIKKQVTHFDFSVCQKSFRETFHKNFK
jgi:hypothetical protein